MYKEYFETLDIHPKMQEAGLKYINSILPEVGVAGIKRNDHEFGEYMTIEVARTDKEPEEDDGEEAWKEYDNNTDLLNEACDKWRKMFGDAVDKLFSNEGAK